MNPSLPPAAGPFHVMWTPEHLIIYYQGPAEHAVYLALDHAGDYTGTSYIPFEAHFKGSTTYVATKVQRIYFTTRAGKFLRRWRGTQWGERNNAGTEFSVSRHAGITRLTLRRAAIRGIGSRVGVVAYAKDLDAHGGWGSLVAATSDSFLPGGGDRYIPHYLKCDLGASAPVPVLCTRLSPDGERVRIYQALPRLFGNRNETRKANGTMGENGVGKFSDFTHHALGEIRAMGFTHLWLTGVVQQATATDYSAIGCPSDDADLLKGLAGSPYAIKDYFDVSPDYADEPGNRLTEFRAVLQRAHGHELKVIIDFVPNHVARSYGSDVRPDLDFGSKGRGGQGDDRSQFFLRDNNFYYLRPTDHGGGPPLRLPTYDRERHVALSPTCQVAGMQADGLFAGEMDHGKVTGNNVISWTPDLNTWYETVKLNYGFDFTYALPNPREFPHGSQPDLPIPDTWQKLDAVFAHWQALGVDGFRCDMSHMIPPEFWAWVIPRARQRQPDVYFAAEAYDNDPAKVPGADPIAAQIAGGHGNVMVDLLNAGFNAVYDDPSYKVLKRIYESGGWANDLDAVFAEDFLAQNSLRYAENHDEVRLAAPREWGGIGMDVGRPVSAILYGLTRGPIMLYHGQEVGEPAAGVEGFGGDDSRTTIFDYWSMPEFCKWVNGGAFDGGRLSDQQRSLRDYYSRLVRLVGEPAFCDGGLWLLNGANANNRNFGRADGDTAGGHWMYAYLRCDAGSGQRFLVVTNLFPRGTFQDVQITIPRDALAWMGLSLTGETAGAERVRFTDRLAASNGLTLTVPLGELAEGGPGLNLPAIAPLSACYFEITTEAEGGPWFE